uniref:ING domain-containing protein n=1 Tax=Strongyloides stercoralis TaxID=6248 RepID=A0A0K0ED97_STRER
MEEFQKIYDKFNEDYQTLSLLYKKTSLEMKDYEELLTMLKILTEYIEESNDDTDIKMQMNLNEYIYADVKLKEKNKVLVKMVENLYAELTYERALIFIEEKITLLVKCLEDYKKQMAKLKAHLDVFVLLKYELNDLSVQ